MTERSPESLDLRRRLDLGASEEEFSRSWAEADEPQRDAFLDDLLTEALLVDHFAERARARRRTVRTWTVSLAAAAALLLTVTAGWLYLTRYQPPHPKLSGDFTVTAADGSAVDATMMQRGSRVTAGKAAATFTLEGRYELTLNAGTQLVWTGLDRKEVIALDEGSLRSVVTPKQGTFTVSTPRGRVEAVGTDFTTIVRYETSLKGNGNMNIKKIAVVSVIVAAGAVACSFDNGTTILSAGMSQVFAAEGERNNPPHDVPREGEVRGGELNGIVVSVEAVKEEGQPLRLALTITTEDGTKDTFIAGPANAQVYATVGSLKPGDSVRLAWNHEGPNMKFIRNIRKLTGDKK